MASVACYFIQEKLYYKDDFDSKTFISLNYKLFHNISIINIIHVDILLLYSCIYFKIYFYCLPVCLVHIYYTFKQLR